MVIAGFARCEQGEIIPSLKVKFLSAGIAACFADLLTFPLDTVKVRLQIQGESLSTIPPTSSLAISHIDGSIHRGVMGTMRQIVTTEGALGLYSGIVAGLQRQMCFASIRIGCYDIFKQKYLDLFKADKRKCPLSVRVLSGMTTGGLSVCLAQPTDVVKIRMQAQGATGHVRYASTLAAYTTIAKQEGIPGLWRGAIPNVTRNAIINVGELVTYDTVKEMILARKLMSDNLPCHFISGFVAGFVATMVASPVDVVKTRYMNSPQGQYTGTVDCALTLFKHNGLQAFYKGFVPSFLRIGSWNVLMFVCFEQLKRFLVNGGGQC